MKKDEKKNQIKNTISCQKMNTSFDVDKNAGYNPAFRPGLWFNKHQGPIVVEARTSADRSYVGCQMGNFPAEGFLCWD